MKLKVFGCKNMFKLQLYDEYGVKTPTLISATGVEQKYSINS